MACNDNVFLGQGTAVNQKFCFKYDKTQGGDDGYINNTTIQITLPDGVIFNSYVINPENLGTYDPVTGLWTIHIVEVEKTFCIDVHGTIDDITAFEAGNQEWTWNLAADGCNSMEIRDSGEFCVTGIGCGDVAQCININSGNNIVVDHTPGSSIWTVNGYGITHDPVGNTITIIGPDGISGTPIPLGQTIAEGNNITITGAGTPADPLVINGCCVSVNDTTGVLTINYPDGSSTDHTLGNTSVVTPVDNSNVTPFGNQAIGDHSDGDGNDETLNEVVTGFTDAPVNITIDSDTQQAYVGEDGEEYCVPKCNNAIPTAANLTDTMVGCKYEGTVADLVGGDCLNPVVKLVNQPTDAHVVMGAGGEFTLEAEDCEDGDVYSWVYQVECENGAVTNATIEITVDLPPPPTAQDDQNVGFIGTPIVGSVIGNDTACDPSCDTEFVVITPPNLGTVSFGTNGGYTYVNAPTTTAPAVDTFEYEIKCCGVLTGVTAIVTIVLFDATPADDLDIVPANNGVDPYTPVALDATDDEDTSTCPGTITYEWRTDQADGLATYTGLVDAAFGIIDGSPDNFTYVPNVNFAGVAYLQYETFCDGLSLGVAMHQIHVTIAQPVDDFSEGDLDTPYTGNVLDNDFTCINGGVTTVEFFTATLDPITVGDLPLLLDGDATTGINLTAFDETTGEYTLTPYGGYGSDGTCMEDVLEYRIICTTPNGNYIAE